MAGRKPNVVLFPFMAQGHLIPFLALAQRLAQNGYAVTFITTPLNVINLKKSLPQKQPFSSSITFAELPFHSSDHGLPPDVETTDSLSVNLMSCFMRATLSLPLPFKHLLSQIIEPGDGERPACVISDFFFTWVSDIVHEFGISHAIFGPMGGFGMACYYSMWLNLPHRRGETVNLEFELPDFPEAGKISIDQVFSSLFSARENDYSTNFHRKMFGALVNSDALLLNTVEDLDQKGLAYFRRKLGIPVFGIGPLLLSEENRAKPDKESTADAEKLMQWLDLKEANSVIYICFGSQKLNALSSSQMMKLAEALDASGMNFIWVLRPPAEFDFNNTDLVAAAEEWLPEGFFRRVQEQDRGLIILKKWVPQMEIMGHESVGAFISHCGWNSVLESLRNGVPILSWPMSADQFYNAKFLAEEVGVGLEMARGNNVVGDVLEKIEMVMGRENEKGMEIRRKAVEIKERIRDGLRDGENYKGCSVKAMEDFFISVLASNI